MKENEFGGGYQEDPSRKAYRDTEAELHKVQISLEELGQKLAGELKVQAELANEFTGEEDKNDLLAIKRESDEIDRQILEAEVAQAEIEKNLDDLMTTAWKAAHKEDGRRRSAMEAEEIAKANREALKEKILPTIHRECEKIHSWKREVENISDEMVMRADDIERVKRPFKKWKSGRSSLTGYPSDFRIF